MPEYTYKALDLSGRTVSGTMDAANESSIVNSLRGKGLLPLEVKQKIASKDLNIDLFQKVTMKDIAVFCRQFSTIIGAGITVVNGLDILRQQTESKKLRDIIDKAFEEVQTGKSLSDTLRQYKEFPLMFVNMVAAGEASGRLDEILQRMAVYYEKEYKLRRQIKSAMSYPAAIAILAVGVVIFLVTSILPTFVGMFQQFDAPLPLPTQIILGFSDSITRYWYVYIISIALIIYIVKRYTSSPEGRYKYAGLLFKLPVIGKINKKMVTSRFARTLSILLSSGVPVIQSMDILEKTITNAVVEAGISKCKDEIRKGVGMSKPISSIKVFPPMLIEMISIGEETGTLDEMLSKTAQFYDEEVDTMVAGLTSLIEPIIIVFLAVIVGFIVISIMLPIFNIYQYAGQ